METKIDYVKNDVCYGCKHALLKPESHIANPWEPRFYCKNKCRIDERLAQVSQKYREFCKAAEDSDKYKLQELLDIRKELDALWEMMREWNWGALDSVETTFCNFKEEA